MNALELQRINPARNMRRFYRLDIEPDLFGGVMLMKQWGRIGARGRVTAERFDDAALALVAMRKQAERKKRRGYACHRDLSPSANGDSLCAQLKEDDT